MPATSESVCVIDLEPEMLEKRIRDGEVAVVDVREDFEHAAERIDGAHHLPLGRITREEVRLLCGDTPVVFHCRSGKRSVDAAHKFGEPGEQVFHLAGGIEAWKNAGKSTIRSASAPKLDVMRQVQVTAGSLVLLGVLLGVFVSPWFLILSGFVGAGLMFAGLTGWCGMAMMLAKLPWNKAAAPTCTPKHAAA